MPLSSTNNIIYKQILSKIVQIISEYKGDAKKSTHYVLRDENSDVNFSVEKN